MGSLESPWGPKLAGLERPEAALSSPCCHPTPCPLSSPLSTQTKSHGPTGASDRQGFVLLAAGPRPSQPFLRLSRHCLPGHTAGCGRHGGSWCVRVRGLCQGGDRLELFSGRAGHGPHVVPPRHAGTNGLLRASRAGALNSVPACSLSQMVSVTSRQGRRDKCREGSALHACFHGEALSLSATSAVGPSPTHTLTSTPGRGELVGLGQKDPDGLW